ncbi:hypothetical protein H312_00932 [Anncaliia algerae PRA339]|uniref:Uncharacterized protein n=1 Tax=Anncaliia algerae PRA339 TaxID=1288291 RepID=A0A059F2Y1_9MICR|nr:hypothetical protein H312_00932 [Anncaliia algerae PRA339]
MSKKNTDFKLEPAEESEIETSNEEIYIPHQDNPELIVDESAYTLLEYISVDWPSQSIELLSNDEVIIATNPISDDPSFVRFNFDRTDNYNDMDNFYFDKMQASSSFNRIRTFKNNIFCIADDSFCIYNKGFNLIKEYKDKFGYGLTHINEKVCASLHSGAIKLIDYNRNKVEERPLHSSSIESLDSFESMIFSASTDKSIKFTDIRTKESVYSQKFSSDINAIAHNKENFVVFGDDDGLLRLMDIRNHQIEEIRWHNTPISMVKFKNEDEFISASDEQVVLWDKGFEEEWEYHKYISFVHQGQKLYKDFCWNENEVYFTTSYEGICIFSPQQE